MSSNTWNDFNFWRIHNNYYTLLVNVQLAIINLQTWCSKWQIFLNISKTNYMVFYDKKKLPPPPDIPVTINEKPLTKIKEKRVLGVIIDENLSFTSHIEQVIKCKTAYNRLTLHPELLPHQALQLYKAYVRTKLEYRCIIWGYTIYHKNHMK